MRKKDLKNGMIVEFKNGCLRMVLNGCLITRRGDVGVCDYESRYDDNFNHMLHKELNINKIYEFNTDFIYREFPDCFNLKNLILKWERGVYLPHELMVTLKYMAQNGYIWIIKAKDVYKKDCIVVSDEKPKRLSSTDFSISENSNYFIISDNKNINMLMNNLPTSEPMLVQDVLDNIAQSYN